MKPAPALLATVALTIAAHAAPLPLIPLPVKMAAGEGCFSLTADTAIRHDQSLAKEAALLAADLAKLTGTAPGLFTEEQKILLSSQILLDLAPDAAVPAGGYKLTVTPGGVAIHGKDAAGAFHGTRTLLQLLPPAGKPPVKTDDVPAVTITDHPRFGWRGMHLDVGRHLFAKDDILGVLTLHDILRRQIHFAGRG